MTAEQATFLCEIRRVYELLLETPAPYENEVAAASMREDDVELARLGGMLIIEMELSEMITAKVAARWLELFKEMYLAVPSAS